MIPNTSITERLIAIISKWCIHRGPHKYNQSETFLCMPRAQDCRKIQRSPMENRSNVINSRNKPEKQWDCCADLSTHQTMSLRTFCFETSQVPDETSTRSNLHTYKIAIFKHSLKCCLAVKLSIDRIPKWSSLSDTFYGLIIRCSALEHKKTKLKYFSKVRLV